MPKDLNKEYALKLGWRPEWFGVAAIDWGTNLTTAVKKFQRGWCLEEDGICGPATYLRLMLVRVDGVCEESKQSEFFPDKVKPTPSATILVKGEHVPIKWGSVITPDEPGALKLTKGFSKRARSGKGVVVHWPVTYSPKSTIKVLNSRKVGTHFEIGPPIGPEGTVTIYQYCDVSYRAWHAVRCNDFVGVDISSPVYAKKSVLKRLADMGHTDRPILSGYVINGWKAPDIVGYHENQLSALHSLLAALHTHAGIVLKAPGYTGDPKIINRVGTWEFIRQNPGVYHHAEVDLPRPQKDGKIRPSGKWDTAGVDLKFACEEARTLI